MLMDRTVVITLSLALGLFSNSCRGFLHSTRVKSHQISHDLSKLKAKARRRNDEDGRVGPKRVKNTRRGFIGITAKVVGLSAVVSLPHSASATVFVDPDRYGDKELKVATVNKIRQTIRDELLKNPALAPLFLKIAMQDGLTYNAATQEDGPDGSIVSVILSSDAPTTLSSLKPAALKLAEIESSIKRTTEITMADIVSFAGAESIETAGGPRVVVQLGKLGSKQVSPQKSYPDLSNDANGDAIIAAFIRSGLTEREVALLFGAERAMDKVISSTASNNDDDSDEEENEMGDTDVFIPSSFGGPSQIYGKQLGKMDSAIFSSIQSDLKKGKQPCATVLSNDKVKEWVDFYANKKNKFLGDLPEAYGKLMSLGARYTGGKVGSLLGGSDSDI